MKIWKIFRPIRTEFPSKNAAEEYIVKRKFHGCMLQNRLPEKDRKALEEKLLASKRKKRIKETWESSQLEVLINILNFLSEISKNRNLLKKDDWQEKYDSLAEKASFLWHSLYKTKTFKNRFDYITKAHSIGTRKKDGHWSPSNDGGTYSFAKDIQKDRRASNEKSMKAYSAYVKDLIEKGKI